MSARQGRPLKLTPQIVAEVVARMTDAVHLHVLAPLLGVSLSSLKSWLARARRHRRAEENGDELPEDAQVFLDLLAAYEKGLMEARCASVGRIRKAAAAGTWTADAWLLERGDPESWGQVAILRRLKNLEEMLKRVVKDGRRDGACGGAGTVAPASALPSPSSSPSRPVLLDPDDMGRMAAEGA